MLPDGSERRFDSGEGRAEQMESRQQGTLLGTATTGSSPARPAREGNSCDDHVSSKGTEGMTEVPKGPQVLQKDTKNKLPANKCSLCPYTHNRKRPHRLITGSLLSDWRSASIPFTKHAGGSGVFGMSCRKIPNPLNDYLCARERACTNCDEVILCYRCVPMLECLYGGSSRKAASTSRKRGRRLEEQAEDHVRKFRRRSEGLVSWYTPEATCFACTSTTKGEKPLVRRSVGFMGSLLRFHKDSSLRPKFVAEFALISGMSAAQVEYLLDNCSTTGSARLCNPHRLSARRVPIAVQEAANSAICCVPHCDIIVGLRPLRVPDDDSSRQDFEDACMTLLEDTQPQSLIGMRICAGHEMAAIKRLYCVAAQVRRLFRHQTPFPRFLR